MNFERCKRKLRSDKGGVSEVVGNILILMITVILFSAIVAYVNQIPVPEMTTKADFSASISFELSGGVTTASLVVTHAGGVSLKAIDTAILLTIDSTTDYTKLSEDSGFDHDEWSMGTDWTKDFTVPSSESEVIVTVIDLEKKISVWVSQVSGGTGGNPPIILQRYIDSNYATPSPDAILEGDDFSFFVKVIDLDNDLNTTTGGVWIDSHDVSGGSSTHTYAEATSDGWFRFAFTGVGDVEAVDGHVIKIHAKDLAGHETISSYVVSVTVLPTEYLSPDTNLPDYLSEGYPPWLTYAGGGQGYALFGENTTSGRADVNDPRSNFTKDEKVFIRVVSNIMKDILGTNQLEVLDTRNGFIYTPEFTSTSGTAQESTAAAPFYTYSVYNQYYIYECQFNTSYLPPSAYALNIRLSSTGDRPANFMISAPMLLEETDSSITFSPAIWVYVDDTSTETQWGTKTTPFEISSAELSVMYVKVKVQDADDDPAPSVDDIRITDMLGNTQLHGTPPAIPMISNWEANTVDPTNQTYDFEISLRLNNGDQWNGGTQAYALKISRFADQNEGVYSLSKMIFVRSSASKSEFMVGASGYMTGTSNFVNPQYLYYIQNNNFFTKRTVYDYSNAPSAADNYAVSALALADIDGDGDKDVLMGQYRSNKLYFIENSMTSYGSWQEASDITRPAADDDAVINCIATGDINGDGDIDFAYSTLYEGTSDGKTVVIYNNTYGASGVLWSGSRYPLSTNDGVRKIALEDMTGDGRADLIVLANGEIRIHDLMEDWDRETYVAKIPSSGSPNIKDFDIADVDQDGMLDVITAQATSAAPVNGVWVNYYSDSASPTERTLTGTTAVPLAGNVLAGDITNTLIEGSGALEVRENASGEDIGYLDLRMQFNTLASDLDQQLLVRAKVSSGATEGFYVWYSLGTVNGPYTPMIYIPATTTDYEDFTIQLPPSVAGQAIYIKVTDTINSTASASVVEILYLDRIVVLTDRHGGYSTNTQQVTSHTLAYDCVRAANMNGVDADSGDLGLEVVVAKDGQWAVYNRTGLGATGGFTALSGWGDTESTFYCRGDAMIDLHSSMNSDENPVRAILTKSSPRLLQVADVNGDGFSDIIVVNATVNPAITSQVAMFLNTYPCADCPWRYFVVKDLAAEFNTPDVTGGMTYLAVENMFTPNSATL
jgi:FlaG/FlaF family flagellin (archaellin)